MYIRTFIFLLFFALVSVGCALSSTAPKSTFASYKQEVVPLGDDALLLTLSGNLMASYQVIASVENQYKKNSIHVIVHTRAPSGNDSDELKLHLSHAVLIPKSISRVFWDEEVIWQRGALTEVRGISY